MPLLVAIHDVAPPHLARVRLLREHLVRWGVGRATLLVVPNHHGEAPLADDPETVRWLRERVAAGDEVALHGYYHQQRGPVTGLCNRLRAALLTAGEGECLAQSAADRARMLAEGRAEIERALDAPVRGFVAPAWLEPSGFGAHLRAATFGWHEGALWVEHRRGSRWLRRRGPVIGFATRTRARERAALAWARLIPPLLSRLARWRSGFPLRVAVHPADVGSPAVLRRLEQLIARLTGHLECHTYAGALLA